MKKMLTFILVAILLFASSLPAIANEDISTANKSTIKLNQNTLFIKAGETSDIYVEELHLATVTPVATYIAFTVNKEILSVVTQDSFSQFGINDFWPASTLGTTEGIDGILSGELDHLKGEQDENNKYIAIVDKNIYINVAQDMASSTSFSSAQAKEYFYPSGERFYEKWEADNAAIADFELSGGHNNTTQDQNGITVVIPTEGYIDQTATVTAVSPGITTIKVTRGGPNYCSVTGECVIIAYSDEFVPGDTDNSKTITASDALGILQHAVGKTTLTDDITTDLNNDSETTATDALVALQIAVGKTAII